MFVACELLARDCWFDDSLCLFGCAFFTYNSGWLFFWECDQFLPSVWSFHLLLCVSFDVLFCLNFCCVLLFDDAWFDSVFVVLVLPVAVLLCRLIYTCLVCVHACVFLYIYDLFGCFWFWIRYSDFWRILLWGWFWLCDSNFAVLSPFLGVSQWWWSMPIVWRPCCAIVWVFWRF